MAKKKNPQIKKKNPVGWIFLSILLLGTNFATVGYFLLLADTVPASDVPMNIGDVSENSDDYLGKTITLNGYYIIAADNPLLVVNPQYFFNNSLGTDNSVRITGTVPESMDTYLGLPCSVKGVLGISNDSDGTLEIKFASYLAKEGDRLFPGSYSDEQLNPYSEFLDIPVPIDTTAEKYAVLYSGGIVPEKAYSRYWNDIIYMYFILLMHGYPAENIYVIYKDGVSEDSNTPVHYPAVHSSLDTVFGILSGEMGLRDDLFFYTTNHGGSSGISVWNPMDSSGALTHSQVEAWLDSITCNQMIIVMEQCVSGKFIPYLSAPNRVIMTACSDGESSYGCDFEGNWDEFVYHFMCALVEISWNGDDVEIQSDYNNDGLISMREAFIWAAASDSRAETPRYNDNGSGIAMNVVQVVFLGEMVEDSIFL
ncbi:MAG: C13 family peptidase [Promethearchaeota archaeon]